MKVKREKPQPVKPARELLLSPERCETCRYYGRIYPDHCHRYPPETVDGVSFYPYVEPWEWCGEWCHPYPSTSIGEGTDGD
jgi:hypothetical protein